MLQAENEPQALSYSDFYQGALSWTQTLLNAGVQPGDIVMDIRQHDLDLLYAFWGTSLLGAVPSILPFPTEKLDPHHYHQSLEALIGVTKPAAIVTYSELAPLLQDLLDEGTSLKAILVKQDQNVSAADEPPGLMRTPDNLALLQHSSGTTGLQKGVALSHRAIFNQLDAYSEAIRL